MEGSSRRTERSGSKRPGPPEAPPLSRRKCLALLGGGALGLMLEGASGGRHQNPLYVGFGCAARPDGGGREPLPSPRAVAPLPHPGRDSRIDLHVHLAGVGAGGTGCFVSQKFRESWFFSIDMWAAGVPRDQVDTRGDQIYVEKLLGLLRSSPWVGRAVVLALDGIYDARGDLDREATDFYVPNSYVLGLARSHPEFLAGASVNPSRRDALEELDRVAEGGAVLIKWLPNSQRIDPAHPRHLPFYRRMAHYRLPLLCHTGEEYALGAGDQTLGDPRRLRPALEEGVTVIAAHCASLGGANGRPYLEEFISLTRVYPHLYGDISALTQFNRRRALPRLLADADLSERLVHGSDYPLPFFPLSSPFYFTGSISLGEMWRIQCIGNLLDRDFETKRALGVPDSVFLQAQRLLAPRLSEKRDPPAGISD